MTFRLIALGASFAALVLALPGTARADDPKSDPPKAPFTFAVAYTADALDNADGGRAQGARYLDKLALSIAYDGAAAGHDGWTALASAQHANGVAFSSDLVGDAQTVSNIDAPEAFRIYEVWAARALFAGRGGVKFGLIDFNSEFDVQETGALFLNSSDGIGPDISRTGLNGPSIYPITALGSTVFYKPADGWTIRAGLFDGVAGDPSHLRRFAIILSAKDGALLIAQVEKRYGDAARLEAGVWSYTARFDALDRFTASGAPRQIGGNAGVYGLVEGKLLAKPKSDDGGLSGWIRVGFGNGDINPINTYLGAGLVYTGLIPGRDKDKAGLAINRAGFGAPACEAARASGSSLRDAETTLEATYGYAFSDWLNIQPDLQYVIHPSGLPQRRNATVIGVRFAFTASR